MASIIEFLEARIAEDEACARSAASDGPSWDMVMGAVHAGGELMRDVDGDESYYGGSVIVYGEGTPDHDQAEHIARHNPSRVLAECAAKRAIAGLHKVGADQCDEHNAMFESVPCPTIRALAAVYADHPDYRQEWSA